MRKRPKHVMRGDGFGVCSVHHIGRQERVRGYEEDSQPDQATKLALKYQRFISTSKPSESVQWPFSKPNLNERKKDMRRRRC